MKQMEVNVDKLSSTTKNIVYLIMLVAQAAWLVFMVYANEKAIHVTDARSEKRYKRGMEVATDHEKRLRNLEAFSNYLKGRDK